MCTKAKPVTVPRGDPEIVEITGLIPDKDRHPIPIHVSAGARGDRKRYSGARDPELES